MASVRRRDPNDDKSPWVVEYTDAEGKRRRETPKTGLKKDADAIRRRIERELADGTQLAKSQTVTVARLCDLYAEHVESKVADGRVGRARAVQIQIHSKSIRARLGSHNLTELTRQHVEAFYNYLIANDKLAPITAKNRISTLRLMQDFAVKRGLMAKAPVADAMKELRGTKKSRIRTFTQEEVGWILQAAADTKPYRGRPYAKCLLECFVNLAAFCGLRFGEIVALKPEAIDLDNRRIHIRHSYCRHAGVKHPKTSAGVRDVPLAPHVVALLRRWTNEFAKQNPEGLLFTTWGGNHVAQRDFRGNYWLPLLQRAGVSGAEVPHFHALRHFAASWMIDNGLPLTDVAKVMGHSTFDMTLQVYAHPVSTAARVRDAFDAMATRMLAAPRTLELTATRLGA